MNDHLVVLFFCVLIKFYIDGTCGLPANKVPNDQQNTPVVVVTGFGPWQATAENPSWKAVATLPNLNLEKELGIKLVIKEIPVAYADVDQIVPTLWQQNSPILTVHAGVSFTHNSITLETQAHKRGYVEVDVNERLPPNGINPKGAEELLKPGIDVNRIKSQAETANKDLTVNISTDAGRYLCEYIFYTSLSINRSATLFIHVPTVDKIPTSKAAESIKLIIKFALEQVRAT